MAFFEGDNRAAELEFGLFENCCEITLPQAAIKGRVSSVFLRPKVVKRSSTGKLFVSLSTNFSHVIDVLCRIYDVT